MKGSDMARKKKQPVKYIDANAPAGWYEVDDDRTDLGRLAQYWNGYSWQTRQIGNNQSCYIRHRMTFTNPVQLVSVEAK